MKRTSAVAVIIQAVSAAFMGAPALNFYCGQKSGNQTQVKASQPSFMINLAAIYKPPKERAIYPPYARI